MEEKRTEMPVLNLRGLTIFPNMTIHFDVGRDISIQALEEALAKSEPIFLIAQKDILVEAPERGDLYDVGTISTVRQILRLQDHNVRVLVEGVSRGRLGALTQTAPFYRAEVEELPEQEQPKNSVKTEALIRETYETFEQYVNLAPKLGPEVVLTILTNQNPGYIADYIAQSIPMRNEDKQLILEELRPVRRLEKMERMLSREVQVLSLEQDVENKVKDRLNENQRDYYLREQMKVIQGELGEHGGEESEFEEYRAKIAALRVSDEVRAKLNKELSHLEKQPFGSAEGSVIRSYLDTCLELPWGKRTRERVNVAAARKILDENHFGLTKVKERILEFLAVKQLSPQLKGQVLCLVGPPGVGKTSIGMSIAQAMNRKLGRISLGGVSDEAEIRGHRKTYVGAMPGRIITAVNQAGTCNPLLLLDEIDKLGRDHRGDPSSALLEVLDGEQNSTFRDNFLEVPFDLSDVLFVTTANTIDTIPRPLLDRMEIIELPSYTDEEKLQIAKKHLLPKERKRHGITAAQMRVTDDAIREIITAYTRESGVRILERQIATLCRKTAMQLVSNDVKRINVTGDNLEEFLGVRKFYPERQALLERVGVVNGLAWTSTGGELLEVEVNVMPGSGKVELTGNLGEVMRESCMTALSFIRSRSRQLHIADDFYKTRDIHVHFPEGAIPKDGPSAGVAITTAMVSALTGRSVKGGIAMTGEVTLRGRILPIGGLREKTMAALRSGIHSVYIPEDNARDLEEIDQTVRAALHFTAVSQAEQVLSEVLNPPREDRDAALPAVLPGKETGGEQAQVSLS